jgi:hypothetical protein
MYSCPPGLNIVDGAGAAATVAQTYTGNTCGVPQLRKILETVWRMPSRRLRTGKMPVLPLLWRLRIHTGAL